MIWDRGTPRSHADRDWTDAFCVYSHQKHARCQPRNSKTNHSYSKIPHSYPFKPLIKSILVSLCWCFALVFDVLCSNFDFANFHFFQLTTSHHGRILGTKSIKTHKIQAGILHLPLSAPKYQAHSGVWTRSATLWNNRHLVYSEGLIIKSILPLLHPEIIQIQTTKWPAKS